MASKRDYYEVLGIARDASKSDVKRAFRRLAMQYHPDRNKDPGAEDRFKEINEAYEVLGDDEKRAMYNQYGHEGLNASGFHQEGFNPFDIFNSVFGDGFMGFDFGGNAEEANMGGDPFAHFFGGNNRRRRAEPVIDLNRLVDVRISFVEAALGTIRDIEYTRQHQCSACSGSGAQGGPNNLVKCTTCDGVGTIIRSQKTPFGFFQQKALCNACHGAGTTIKEKCRSCNGEKLASETIKRKIQMEPGLFDQDVIAIKNEGSRFNGQTGDLFVRVNIAPSNIFERAKNDVIVRPLVDPIVALVGGTIQVPTLQGPKEIALKPRTANGERIIVAGGGIRYVDRGFFKNSRRVGDLIVIIAYARPVEFTKAELKKLRELVRDNPEVDAYAQLAEKEFIPPS